MVDCLNGTVVTASRCGAILKALQVCTGLGWNCRSRIPHLPSPDGKMWTSRLWQNGRCSLFSMVNYPCTNEHLLCFWHLLCAHTMSLIRATQFQLLDPRPSWCQSILILAFTPLPIYLPAYPSISCPCQSAPPCERSRLHTLVGWS